VFGLAIYISQCHLAKTAQIYIVQPSLISFCSPINHEGLGKRMMLKQKGFVQPLTNLPKPSLWLLGIVAAVLFAISVVFAVAAVLKSGGTLEDYKVNGEVLFIGALGIVAMLMFLFFQQRSVHKALLDSEDRFRNILENAPIGMAVVSLPGKFLQVNHALCDMLGYSREELKQLTFQEITHPDDLPTDLAYANELLKSQRSSYRLDKRYITKSGEPIWVQLIGSVMRSPQGRPLYFIAQVEDISDRKSEQDKLYYVAYFDPLTHLPNRRMLMDRVEQAVALARHHYRYMAVLFLALDGFRRIVDQLGPEVGDQLLKQAAARLVSALRDSDTVSHFGENQFAILLPEVSSPDEALQIVPKVLAVLEDHLVVFGQHVEITTSIGGAVYEPAVDDSASDLLKRAEIEMCEVRTAGRNSFSLYIPEKPSGKQASHG
jgi:PAS domain S-box-containing protein/diguanylate cyclase (GGDEF)-like protein